MLQNLTMSDKNILQNLKKTQVDLVVLFLQYLRKINETVVWSWWTQLEKKNTRNLKNKNDPADGKLDPVLHPSKLIESLSK